MEVSLTEKEVVIKLSLSMKEAEWLKAMVQNPLDSDGSAFAFLNESEENCEMRRTFWEALTIAGVK